MFYVAVHIVILALIYQCLVTICKRSFRDSTNGWYLNIDKGKYTGLIFIDLKKAFDEVDHEILLKS